jgi:hypothetical protein
MKVCSVDIRSNVIIIKAQIKGDNAYWYGFIASYCHVTLSMTWAKQ